MISPAPNYHGYRFPPDIIAHAVWLSFRFSLSVRHVEDCSSSAPKQRVEEVRGGRNGVAEPRGIRRN